MAISTKIILIFRAIGTNEKMKPQKGVLLTRWILEMQAKNFAVYRNYRFYIFNYDYRCSTAVTIT